MIEIAGETIVAKKGPGRPTKGRTQSVIRIDTDLVQKVRWLASLSKEKTGIGDYLSDLVRPLIEKKHEAEAKKAFGTKDDR